jgi:ATP-dependent DNA ligase
MRLAGRRSLGTAMNARTADDGATIFQQACRMGLEGIVSKD